MAMGDDRAAAALYIMGQQLNYIRFNKRLMNEALYA